LQATSSIVVGALARAMSIHQSTASNLVRTLIERELVAAAREAADRRTVQLRSLEPATLQRLHAHLARLIVALGADERGGAILLSDL
jgi:DNA-binding MarR family transcriptional regulator